MTGTVTLRTSMQRSLTALALFSVVSTVGFFVLGRLSGAGRSWLECLRYTASIFSTVGDMPRSRPFSPAETVWEIAMIVFGIGAAVYAFTNVMALVTSGEIRRMLGRRQLIGKIRMLENHYIVCGFGRMGQAVGRALAEASHRFIVIDNTSEKTATAEERGYVYLLGDAADETVLKSAGIDRARGLVASLPHDADNVFVTLTARQLNDRLLIVARAEQETTEKRLLRAGATRVICPQVIGATKATRMLLNPALEDMLDATMHGDFAFDRIDLADLPAMAGKTLLELGLPRTYGLMVLAVQKGDGTRLFSPPAEHRLSAGDRLVVIGPRDAVDRLAKDHEAS